jgi:hypothetical protein
MALLQLTNQENAKKQIAPKLVQLRQLLDSRKELWQKIDAADRKKWVQSGKDPIMTIAWQIYQYLDANFFGRKYRHD